MTQDQRNIYIERIKTLPERLEELIRTFSIEQLDTPYGKGKWTVRQVVHHLADAHLHGIIRKERRQMEIPLVFRSASVRSAPLFDLDPQGA